MNQDIIFFDVETSDLDNEKGEIIEIAAMRVDMATESVIAQTCDKIRPTKPVNPKAAAVNHYTEKDWADAVPFKAALETLKNALLINKSERYIIVAHNVMFDQLYLRADCKRNDVDMPFAGRKWIDTFHLSWPLLVSGAVEDQALGTVARYFGVPVDNQHTAMGDVMILAGVYHAMMKRYTLIAEAESTVRNWGKSIVEKGLEIISGGPPTQVQK